MSEYERELERLRAESGQSVADGLPLFAEVRVMARRTDPQTSRDAALAIVDGLPTMQRAVLAAFREHGPMSAKAAEGLPEFAHYGFSTIRKRCSDLAARGYLRKTGRIVDGCAEYEAAGDTHTPEKNGGTP